MSEPLWYKDAIIYELHVRAFFDGDGDGQGDFRGLTAKLDYLADLGVTALWLLPFYPSPLKDDGYDIADYTGVHPDFGSLRDVRTLVRAAHERGLRVITELVCNHTSDQHPWFQRARRSPPGSAWRNYYVWSDSPDRYPDARIIFKDFETSNWAWDPVAGAYYWHRFYSHQPDLNFDSPRVRRALTRALDFWLDLGIDGLRLDAVPYLFERDGTNGENLAETHAFLRELRAHVDERYDDRMLLAEANQWPEDSAAYFGDGDECHMAFHFPVMPRMYMALRMEDRFPLVDIMEQTPPIPDSAQWALFLRNHDELTLEMVTDEERDYMYRVYAQDPQMRLNLGIRRRLAPLMGNNRRRIELLNGLLFSLPGTPVLYYGDEIGMGDNVYLGDRNGVRTPMQWSGDRNAGFSPANRQRLFLPVITDPEYHYEATNVAAQQGNPHSLLWWTKRLIALRKGHRAFGRGSLEFLHPENRKVLAFIREHEGERILVVANLSRYVQFAELDLSAYPDLMPVEMFGQGEFPALHGRPFFVTLGPHAFYWFLLVPAAERMTSAETGLPQLPPVSALSEVLSAGAARSTLVRLLPAYMRARRWFGGKSRRIREVRVRDHLALPGAGIDAAIALIDVFYTDGDPETYALPLALVSEASAQQLAETAPQAFVAGVDTHDGREQMALVDASFDPRAQTGLLKLVGGRRRLRSASGTVLESRGTPLLKELGPVHALESQVSRAEQSNTSIVYGDLLILKLFRRLQPGGNPDLEIGRVLTERGFAHTPEVCGWLELQPSKSEPLTVAMLQRYVPNEGDVWEYTLDTLGTYYDRAVATPLAEPQPRSVSARTLIELAAAEPPADAREQIGGYLETARLLGLRTAELHVALGAPSADPGLAPEPITSLYRRSQYQGVRAQLAEALALLRRRREGLPAHAQDLADLVLGMEGKAQGRLRALLQGRMDGQRSRIHGDYHAGQALWTGRDVVIIDFEGEPMRPISERRHKHSPLRDVAGMLRSFHYAANVALRGTGGGRVRTEDVAGLGAWANSWYCWVASAFLGAYLEAMHGSVLLPTDSGQRATLLDFLLMQKASYELIYELNNRPDWVAVPLSGILDLLTDDGDGTA